MRSHIIARATYDSGVLCGSVNVLRGNALIFRCDFMDGLPHGPSTSFWGIDSEVASSGTWTMGCGILSLHHDNAAPYRSEAFTGGLRHGTSTEYRRSGTLRYTQEYVQVIYRC